jgi:hypothetical protein
MDMNELSDQSEEDKIEQESVEEMDRQVSDDKSRIPRWRNALEVQEPPSPAADSYFPWQLYRMNLMMDLLTDLITRYRRASQPTSTLKYFRLVIDAESCQWITRPTTHSGTE